MKRILVTGAAGFIGSALVKKLLDHNETIVGIDNLNNYYDKNLKKIRLENIQNHPNSINNWKFVEIDIVNNLSLDEVFKKFKPSVVVNLAAQAGVRYSLEKPDTYVQTNLVGFGNILEQCKKANVENLIYASSSSVYGLNQEQPYIESQGVDHPISIYAATKKSNELMAHAYSHLFNIPTTGLRFFTVYGPWGRPDMAPFIFAKSILNEEPLKIYNFGKMKRDFTYIDDIVEGIMRCCYKPATSFENFNKQKPNPSVSSAPYRIFNIGNNKPIEILDFVELLGKYLGKKAIINYEPFQKCEVKETFADTQSFNRWVGFSPQTSLEEGTYRFVKWYKNFFKYL